MRTDSNPGTSCIKTATAPRTSLDARGTESVSPARSLPLVPGAPDKPLVLWAQEPGQPSVPPPPSSLSPSGLSGVLGLRGSAPGEPVPTLPWPGLPEDGAGLRGPPMGNCQPGGPAASVPDARSRREERGASSQEGAQGAQEGNRRLQPGRPAPRQPGTRSKGAAAVSLLTEPGALSAAEPRCEGAQWWAFCRCPRVTPPSQSWAGPAARGLRPACPACPLRPGRALPVSPRSSALVEFRLNEARPPWGDPLWLPQSCPPPAGRWAPPTSTRSACFRRRCRWCRPPSWQLPAAAPASRPCPVAGWALALLPALLPDVTPGCAFWRFPVRVVLVGATPSSAAGAVLPSTCCQTCRSPLVDTSPRAPGCGS